MNTITLVALIAAALTVAAAAFLLIRREKRPSEDLPMDDMEGHDFEYYCAELLKDNGFKDVEVTKGSGDFGADILARKGGISYAVQCKCYDGPVGVFAVQEVYAGRDYYGCMVGAVMTNQYFTAPAWKLAGRLHILLWDRDVLEQMDAER